MVQQILLTTFLKLKHCVKYISVTSLYNHDLRRRGKNKRRFCVKISILLPFLRPSTFRELIFANEIFRHITRTNFREQKDFRGFAGTNFREWTNSSVKTTLISYKTGVFFILRALSTFRQNLFSQIDRFQIFCGSCFCEIDQNSRNLHTKKTI